MSKCDFCGAPNPLLLHGCKDFESDSEKIGAVYRGQAVTLRSQGAWAACSRCTLLIDDGDLAGLVHRAKAVYGSQGYIISPQLEDHLCHTYELFLANRTGCTMPVPRIPEPPPAPGHFQREFDSFCEVCFKGISEQQYNDLRRTFFGGAAAFFGIVNSLSSEEGPTSGDLAIIEGLQRELSEFNEAVKRGEK